jgi:hypothetical protein
MTAGAAVVLALMVLQSHLSVRSEATLPPGTTWWYYYQLAIEMFDARAIPSTIGEWGAQRPYPIEYLATTAHTAATAVFGGGVDLPFIEGYRLVVMALVAVSAYALWRRWLPAWWAWVAAILTVAATRISSRLVGYRPETFGLVLVLWSGWLLDEALARRSLRWGLLAGLVSGTAFHAHAEVWLLTGPLWLGIVISRIVTAIWRTDEDGRRPTTARTAVMTTDATEAGVAAAPAEPRATGAAVHSTAAPTELRSPRGSVLRPAGVLASAAFAFILVALMAVAAGTGSRLAGLTDQPTTVVEQPAGDPTWAFFAVINGFDPVLFPPPGTFWDTYFQDPATAVPYPFVTLTEPLALLLVLGALAAVVVHLRRSTAKTRRLVITCVLFAVGIFVGSYVIWIFYDTYVPQRAGPRRILPFYAIGLAGLIALAAWTVARLVARVAARSIADGGDRATWRTTLPKDDIAHLVDRRPVRALALRAVALFAGILLVGQLLPTHESLGSGGRALSNDGYAALEWIRDNLPDDAIVLANAYTDGSVGAISRRTGWIDGRAPYLEDPEWLAEATVNVQTARDFFYDPQIHGPPDGVDYVLAGRTEDLAGYATMEVYWEGFADWDRVRVLREFVPGELVLFEILPPPEAA